MKWKIRSFFIRFRVAFSPQSASGPDAFVETRSSSSYHPRLGRCRSSEVSFVYLALFIPGSCWNAVGPFPQLSHFWPISGTLSDLFSANRGTRNFYFNVCFPSVTLMGVVLSSRVYITWMLNNKCYPELQSFLKWIQGIKKSNKTVILYRELLEE